MSSSSTPAAPARMRRGHNLLSSRALQVTGFLLVGLLIAAVAGVVVYQHEREIGDDLERNELLARVIEEHAARTIDAAAQAVDEVAAAVLRLGHTEIADLHAELGRTLSGTARLRALAVVEPGGRVIASTDGSSIGRTVDWSRWASPSRAGQAALLEVVAGRGLPLIGAVEAVPPGLRVLPFVRTIATAAGDLHVFALLNPDVFANFQELTLNDPRRAAALVAYDGRVVASTVSAALPVDRVLDGLPPLRSHLPHTERAAWVGAGLRTGSRIAAFRTLRQYPLWVIVDMDRAGVTAAVAERMRWFVMAGGAAALMLGLLTIVASRRQRDHERDRLALDEAQSALAARGRELDGVFASVRELLFRTDATGAVELINARWERTTGRPSAQARGQPLETLVAPQSRRAVAALFDAESGAAPRQAEAVIDGPQGQSSRFELTVVPLLEEGRLSGFAGCGVDVTQLQAAQAQLRAQLAFNDALVESHPLPVVVRDTMNRYVRVNHAWEAFFGRSRDRVIGTLASLVHPPELAPVHDGKARELVAQGSGEVHYEAQALRADGQLRDLAISMALIPGADGRPAGIVSVFMDVSEFREAERATRLARDAAEAASNAKSEFIASVSHELRTPLQSILGFSEIGMQRVDAAGRAGALFGDIHRAGTRMLTLVDDLLDLSRLDRRVPSLQTLRLDVRTLLADIGAEVEPLAQARGVELRFEQPAVPLFAHLDGARMSQVVRNLLANAIRLSPQGQAVSLVVQAGPAGTIELRVADRGPGIPPAELERIFEPFVQLSATKGAAGGGTGLGLAISRRIVDAHGGRITAANREGGGAVFTVELHAAQVGESQPSRVV